MNRHPPHRRPPLRSSVGFTLLEMLIAVAVFAIASALAYGGLDAVLRARGQLRDETDRLARVQFAVGLIERDLRAAARRGVRGGYGERLPALEGTESGFELTRHGHANALALPRAELQRVGYLRRDGELLRMRYPVLDRAPASRPEVDVLLEGVTALRLRYLRSDGRELSRWPARDVADLSPDALPEAVEVELEIDGVGSIRRVLELVPEPAPLPRVGL